MPTVGANALIAAAAPLLVAAARIGRGRAPDPDQLRRSMVEAVREFETRAVATGLDTHSLRAARYALCATIDDLVLSTPWGSSSSWVTRSLTSIFHNEVTGGERFFDILEQMQKDPGRHAEVVELMYLCASLGFEGRYRVLGRGSAALTELRDGLYRGIRQRRGEFERELSPQWRGIDTGGRRLGWRVPLWLIGLGTLGRGLRDLSGLQPLSGRHVGHRLRRVRGTAAARSRQGRAGRRGRHRRHPRRPPLLSRARTRPGPRCTSSCNPRSRPAWCRCWRIRSPSPCG